MKQNNDIVERINKDVIQIEEEFKKAGIIGFHNIFFQFKELKEEADQDVFIVSASLKENNINIIVALKRAYSLYSIRPLEFQRNIIISREKAFHIAKRLEEKLENMIKIRKDYEKQCRKNRRLLKSI